LAAAVHDRVSAGAKDCAAADLPRAPPSQELKPWPALLTGWALAGWWLTKTDLPDARLWAAVSGRDVAPEWALTAIAIAIAQATATNKTKSP
jgi:hypothetical protein